MVNKSAFKAAKGIDGVSAWCSGTTYPSGSIREKDFIFYKSNTTTAQSFVPSEWDIVGVKSAGNTNEIQLSDGIEGFLSDSNFTWNPSTCSLNVGAYNTNNSIYDHNFTFGYSNALQSGDTKMNWVFGNDQTIGKSRWGMFFGELNKAYGGGRKQNAFSMGVNNCHISTGTQFGGVAIGQYNIVSGNTYVPFALGFKNRVSGNFALATGVWADAQGVASWVHGEDLSRAGTVPISQRVLAQGRHAINMSANDTGQTAGYGANADISGIFGGKNHHIDTANTGATIIGGKDIVLTGSSYADTTVVDNFAVWSTPSAGDGSDEVLVWDTTDKIVKKVSQASIGGATIGANNGLTKVGTDIELGGTLTGDTTIDTAGFGLVLGTNSVASGTDALAQGGYANAIGNYSISAGLGTCARGSGSFTSGVGISGTKPIYAYGTAAFNVSENTPSQTVGHGALANNSVILGGINHNIESGNARAAIIGGNAIKLTGSSYVDTTAVANLAIMSTPTTGTDEDVLVWDSVTGKINKVPQLSISSGSFWNATGNTDVQDTITVVNTDTLDFIFNGSAGSTNSLTLNPTATANQGELLISVQNSAANRTTTLEMDAQNGFDLTTVGSTPINIESPIGQLNFGTTDTIFYDLRSAGSQTGLRYGGTYDDDLVNTSLITKGFGDARYLTGGTSGLTLNIESGYTSGIFAESIGGTSNVGLISFQNNPARSVTDYFTDVFVGPSNGNPSANAGGNIAVGQGNLLNITPSGSFSADPWYSTFQGDRNVAIGFDIMQNMTGDAGNQGSGNIGIGERVLNQSLNNSYNVALGFHAMRNFNITPTGTNGSSNIAIGNYVMQSVTGGCASTNIVLGPTTLSQTQNIGYSNVVLGNESMTYANNINNSNIAIGDFVAYNACDGVDVANVMIGSGIMPFVTCIHGTNVMIGPSIGWCITGATHIEEDNVMIGNSVYRNGDLSANNGHNTAIGAGAAWYGGGCDQTIYGNHAGWLIRGGKNIAIGHHAGKPSDLSVQYFCTYQNPPGTPLVGQCNAFIGFCSGFNVASSGNSNAFVIGSNYCPTFNDGEFKIGAQSNLYIETNTTGTTNTFTFSDGLYFGDGDSGFYQISDNRVDVKLANINRWYFSGNLMGANNGNGGAISSCNSSSTLPTLLPQGNASTTGIGGIDNELSLIVNGEEKIKLTTGTTQFSGDTNFIGAINQTGNTTIVGGLAATFKDFDIPHPTKPNKRLRHSAIEGAERGVYFRGKLQNSNIIELPEYWTELVNHQTISVNLTPYKTPQNLYVKEIINNTIVIENSGSEEINTFFTVFAERKDVDKIIVEY